MNKKMNFAAIIAVVVVTLSAMWFTSCTADDEYGNFEFDTLAEGLVTRSGDPGGGESESQALWMIEEGETTETVTVTEIFMRFDFNIKWESGFLSNVHPDVSLNAEPYNGSPNLEYYDKYFVKHTLKKYQYVDCIFETPAKIDGNKIRVDLIKILYKRAKEKIDENGQPVYYIGDDTLSVHTTLEYDVSNLLTTI